MKIRYKIYYFFAWVIRSLRNLITHQAVEPPVRLGWNKCFLDDLPSAPTCMSDLDIMYQRGDVNPPKELLPDPPAEIYVSTVEDSVIDIPDDFTLTTLGQGPFDHGR